MSYDESAFEGAAAVIHGNYSETGWESAEFSERMWARGTLRAALDKLGPDPELAEKETLNTALRAATSKLSETLTRVWRIVTPGGSTSFGVEPDSVVPEVEAALERAKAPIEDVEITDGMLNTLALDYWGPAVVYDREKLRSALANALQTR